MQFRLLIDAPIRPRQQANLAHIHEIRKEIHPQMKRLWAHSPLSRRKDWIRERPDKEGDVAILEDRDGRQFVPLITDKAALYCKIEVLFLRTERPGNLIGEGGDIDNRLKTLFDALRVPGRDQVQNLRPDINNDGNPLFCVVRDDSLITAVGVDTDRLLTSEEPHDMRVIVRVQVLATELTWGNMDLVST
jgi:hypothetical protein